MKSVEVTVVSQKGTCAHRHKVGDSWICGALTPEGMCASAFAAIYPTIRGLSAGGKFDWGNADGSVDMCCPDHINPLVLRLKPVE